MGGIYFLEVCFCFLFFVFCFLFFVFFCFLFCKSKINEYLYNITTTKRNEDTQRPILYLLEQKKKKEREEREREREREKERGN